jgi:hypothetical protein
MRWIGKVKRGDSKKNRWESKMIRRDCKKGRREGMKRRIDGKTKIWWWFKIHIVDQ